MSNPPLDPLNPKEYQDLLAEASSLFRLEAEFWDIWGQRHTPGDAVKRAILQSLGVPCDRVEDLREALGAHRRKEWTRLLPPTLVVTVSGRPAEYAIRVPLPLGGEPVKVRLLWEDGHEDVGSISLADWPETAREQFEDGLYIQKAVQLPFRLSPGYFQLTLETGDGKSARVRLIAAPEQAWLPPHLKQGGRTAGVAISLYGVRSKRNWGCGDFTDLQHLLEWLKEDLHGSFLALNPLHAIDNRQPYNISPYLPNSALFRNPIYVDIEAIPEFAESKAAQRLAVRPAVQEELKKLREAEFVEYERVWRIKRLFLAVLFREFLRRPESARAACFGRYLKERGAALDSFAVYCALWDHLHRRNKEMWIWPQWPPEFQEPGSPAIARFRDTHPRQVLFHKFIQWVLDEQLESAQTKARTLGLPIGLYHDLALATDKCGADLWAYRPYYVSGCRVGSPPDGFAPEGQDWAFPPPHAEKLREDGYQLFIESIRANSRHGGALRMDHVMRLFRLYWIPDGMAATNGAYVRDFHEDLLGILALESVRNQFFLVGEDLGTVADNVRHALDRYGVLSYKVFYFEKDPSGRFRYPEEYPRQALVSSTTHDIPTLAGYWTGRDIEARRNAGLLPDEGGYQRQRAEREQDKQRMLEMLHELKLVPHWCPRVAGEIPELTGELHNAIIGFLVHTPSMVMVLNQEDLTKETEQQNLPASTWQYPNWRRKMKYTVEELRSNPVAQDFALMFRNWLAASGRANP